MNVLAEQAFEFLWHLLFDGEETIELDCGVAWQESLPDYLSRMSEEEKRTLSEVAGARYRRLTAAADAHGHTRRTRMTGEQREFPGSLIPGGLFERFGQLDQGIRIGGYGVYAIAPARGFSTAAWPVRRERLRNSTKRWSPGAWSRPTRSVFAAQAGAASQQKRFDR
ncbi:hypothetical protein OK348_12570 [Flavobacterium sp. MXW15]|uniref:Uncharacterized protein n=1 Tax=Xanthomonas chitinilytica TaxID=2989819 RepID=A0ABT3JXE3_9XANT|nr:hypothetical protein [Xanthomonas sp. H13-6]MCW4455620.1 hypothetical protein [Flavobacterium sp. MXW15]MCW4472894.1 hypothetical protein [Xanthomonas sp. H13-6]